MEIKELREQINQIDAEMALLFTKRMELVSLIAKYKKENNLPIFDEEREKEIIKKNLELIKDEHLKEYYLIFFKALLIESKRYQEYLNSK